LNSKVFFELFEKHPAVLSTIQGLYKGGQKGQISRAENSFYAILIAHAFLQTDESIIVCCESEEEARYIYSDIAVFLPGEPVYSLIHSAKKSYNSEELDLSKIQDRTQVLDEIINVKDKKIVVTYPEAMIEKLADEKTFISQKTLLKVGEIVDFDFLIEVLEEYGFEREDFIEEVGQYAIRGGIIDIFSFNAELPYRIELVGRKIDTIRTFNPVSQLSENQIKVASILPNVQQVSSQIKNGNIFKLLGERPQIFMANLISAFDEIANYVTDEDSFYLNINELSAILKSLSVVEFSSQTYYKPAFSYECQQQPPTIINNQFNYLADTFEKYKADGFDTVLFSDLPKQVERLDKILEDQSRELSYTPIFKGLSGGFIDSDVKVYCHTEHQIFKRYYKPRGNKRTFNRGELDLKAIRDLKIGDYVVHIDHGIGIFKGLQKMEMGGNIRDAVKIEYKNGDLLYVNIGALHKLSKYKSGESEAPKINKLGSDAWQKLKQKTKGKVKDIARDLIKLYAARKKAIGFAFSPDNYLQVELEASFMYEDTPDQASAIAAVKADMEQESPMDRLVCGDVGFGKTEVAIRAAFKAVCDSKQVAVLVPTTILAHQHYKTFKARLYDFPCNVDFINRFRTTKQVKETLKNLEDGNVNIIIGTHKLLGKTIKFKDLGLLIIDEEQKFGVAAKEAIKRFKVNVDTLTLTATPIPRTLHFSLMGARDLSIINTPPPNRRPIHTELLLWDDEKMKQAIEFEMQRGGQVFVIHNRVKDIYPLADKISTLVPSAKVAVGHGQLKGDDLENVMVQFIEKEFDVLVATTIIESGLDIPNANTIIINNAHYFGLSDLHQMRGRVGRSNIKAFCYLMAPSLFTLSEDSRRRLLAMEKYADLGSGFQVAMQDMDIRGTGNMLGGEQSGFISEIGFAAYHKILDEAVQELRKDEFSELFEDAETIQEIDCAIEISERAYFPENYVSNVSERINLYSRLAQIKTLEELVEFESQLVDRFGPCPKETRHLINTVILKIKVKPLYCDKIRLVGGKMKLYFSNDLSEEYYQSEIFGNLLQKVSNHPQYRAEQSKTHLILNVHHIESLNEAIGEVESLIS
jgi:transcription-repair coupling factor (superfamily II helicase)